ncbi:hypothetical protein Esti_003140 [Eimeria stiedai]
MGEEAPPTAPATAATATAAVATAGGLSCGVCVALGSWGDVLPVFAVACNAALLLSSNKGAPQRDWAPLPTSALERGSPKASAEHQQQQQGCCIALATHACWVSQLLVEASVRGLSAHAGPHGFRLLVGDACSSPSSSSSAAACDAAGAAAAAAAGAPLIPVGEGLPLWLLPLPSPPVRPHPSQPFDKNDAELLVPLLQGRCRLCCCVPSHRAAAAAGEGGGGAGLQQEQQRCCPLETKAAALGLFAAVYVHAAAAAKRACLLLLSSPYSRRLAPRAFFEQLFDQLPELRPMLHASSQQQQQQRKEEAVHGLEAWAVWHASRVMSQADLEEWMWRLCLSDSGTFRESCLGLPPCLFEAAAADPKPSAAAAAGVSLSLPTAAPLLCLYDARLFAEEAEALPPFAAAVGPAMVPWGLLLNQQQQQQQQQQQGDEVLHRVRLFGAGGVPIGPSELLLTEGELRLLLRVSGAACKQPHKSAFRAPSCSEAYKQGPFKEHALSSTQALWKPAAAAASTAAKRQRIVQTGARASSRSSDDDDQEHQQQQQQHQQQRASQEAVLKLLPRVPFCTSSGSNDDEGAEEETGGGEDGGCCIVSLGSMLCSYLNLLPCWRCLVSLCAHTARLLRRSFVVVAASASFCCCKAMPAAPSAEETGRGLVCLSEQQQQQVLVLLLLSPCPLASLLPQGPHAARDPTPKASPEVCVVSHGSAGAAHTFAKYLRLPHLMLPLLYDQQQISKRMQRAGLGLAASDRLLDALADLRAHEAETQRRHQQQQQQQQEQQQQQQQQHQQVTAAADGVAGFDCFGVAADEAALSICPGQQQQQQQQRKRDQCVSPGSPVLLRAALLLSEEIRAAAAAAATATATAAGLQLHATPPADGALAAARCFLALLQQQQQTLDKRVKLEQQQQQLLLLLLLPF